MATGVFLSHASADKPLARRLARDLRAAGLEVWLDQWVIGVGESFEQHIAQGLADTRFVIVLLTPAAVRSEWVEREWRSRFEDEARSRQVHILPVRGEPCEMPDFLAQRSHADLSAGSYPLGLRHLLALLAHHGAELAVEREALDAAGALATDPQRPPLVRPITLELGSGLTAWVEPDAEGRSHFLDTEIPMLRDGLCRAWGFEFPGIAVRGESSWLPPGGACILLDELPLPVFELPVDEWLCEGTPEALQVLGIAARPGRHGLVPAGRSWVPEAQRARVHEAGLDLWGPTALLTLHLYHVIRAHVAVFVDVDVARRLVDGLGAEEAALAARVLPARVRWIELADVMARLLDEGTALREPGRMVAALADLPAGLRDTQAMTERVRQVLLPGLTGQFLDEAGRLPAWVLGADAEAAMLASLQPLGAQGDRMSLPGAAALVDAVVATVPPDDSALPPPIVVVSPRIRPFLRRLVQQARPRHHVYARAELPPGAEVLVLGVIDWRPA